MGGKYFMRHKQRKETGLPYHYDDPEIMGEQLKYMEKLYDYNATRPLE
jgi:galactoside O-acetyltransferase